MFLLLKELFGMKGLSKMKGVMMNYYEQLGDFTCYGERPIFIINNTKQIIVFESANHLKNIYLNIFFNMIKKFGHSTS